MCWQDMADLEEAIGGHLVPPGTLGRPFRAMRGFRTLLFAGAVSQTTAQCSHQTARLHVLHVTRACGRCCQHAAGTRMQTK